MKNRDRRLQSGPNAAVKASLAKGEIIGDYIGSPPVFAPITHGMMVTGYRKITPAIPFVRRPFNDTH